MKPLLSSRFSNRSGFTLVELLVVIGIIAILASVLFTVGGSAIRAAQRVKLNQLASSIQTSALNYYTEYSVYPVPTANPVGQDYLILDTDTTAWPILIEALCGNINPANGTTVAATTIPNTRNIPFLNLKVGDVVSVAIPEPKNTMAPNAAINPTFNIAMDSDYDGVLGGTSSSAGKLPNFATATTGTAPPMTGSSTAGVAVWANCNGVATSQNPNFWVHTY